MTKVCQISELLINLAFINNPLIKMNVKNLYMCIVILQKCRLLKYLILCIPPDSIFLSKKKEYKMQSKSNPPRYCTNIQ